MNVGKLVFFAGKMAAGKSTKSLEIRSETNAVLLSEDDWLGAAYPNEIRSLDDYIKYSSRLKPQIKSLAQAVLLTGTDVVLDFPANTISQRAWFRGIFSEIGAAHELIYLKLSDAECLERIAKRRIQQPERATTDTEEMFQAVTKHFVEPSTSEGFTVTVLPV